MILADNKGLKRPGSLPWVWMHHHIGLLIDISWRVQFRVAIVSVGHWWNLWPKPNSLQSQALMWDNHYWQRSADVPTTDANGFQDVKVQVSSDTLYDIMICSGWPDSYPERNALISHLFKRHNLQGCMTTYHRAHGMTAIPLSWAL